MKKLTSMQKKVLKSVALEYKRKNGKLPRLVSDLDYSKQVIPIININPYENSDDDMNSFLRDLWLKDNWSSKPGGNQ